VQCAMMPSVDQLVERLSEEIDAARERLRLFQTDATQVFAAGKREYQGRTYHFCTKELLQAFENAPSEYVEVAKS
jgi:YHS domain-containing protein